MHLYVLCQLFHLNDFLLFKEHCALYFRNLTTEEMRDKLIESLQEYSLFRIRHMHLIGPNGIRIRLTNNVIQNMKNESIYTCSLIKGFLI